MANGKWLIMYTRLMMETNLIHTINKSGLEEDRFCLYHNAHSLLRPLHYLV